MAENAAAPAAAPPTGPRDPNPSRGGRRRGRGGGGGGGGGSNQAGQAETHRDEGRGDAASRGTTRSRGGGGGGGGGGRGRHDKQNRSQNKNRAQAANAATGGGGQPSGPAPSGPGTSGDRSTGDAVTTESEDKGKRAVAAAAAQEEAEDGEICFICASRVEHTSVSPCNHRTCHICALRLRALYKTKACAHCRTESPFVIFTDDPNKRYEAFTEADFARTDENLGIKYEKEEIFEDTVLLLRYNCPDKECDVACLGWPDLHRHVKSKHGKVMCDLCTRHKKVFTHEHELFSMSQLRKHEKYGDDRPGAADQTGFKGHPECGFCRVRFYGDDELYAHCRDRHERCHICDRRSGNRQQQYFIDYNALEEHFWQDHFLCMDRECLEKKFVVFESEMDLKAHQLEVHPAGLSKDARRDMRTVNMSTFDYRTPYQPERQRRGAGRGRDPNAEPLPVSSAQPLRRDELAFQRQLAIQSAQSVSTRTFGGQLTPSDSQTSRAPARPAAAGPTPAEAAAAARASPNPPVSAMENLTITTDLSPQEQARRLRHAAVIERASNLLRNDQTKIAEFRTKVSNYRASAISATDLIDAFFSLFDTSSTELGKLIKELADIYEDEGKRAALLKAWNDWRAINEDYPALPGPSGVLPGLSPGTVNGAGAGGKRVLRLKSSTAQSSRSAVGGNPFPPLSASTSAPRTSGPTTTTVWGTAGPSTSATSRPSPSTTTRPTAASSASASSSSTRPNPSDAEAFPALHAAPKPNVLMAGLTRGTVRWDDRRGPTPNAWGTGPGPSASASASANASGTETDGDVQGDGNLNGNAGGKKGKGRKGKQTLFHFG